jgi:hypothetical protein
MSGFSNFSRKGTHVRQSLLRLILPLMVYTGAIYSENLTFEKAAAPAIKYAQKAKEAFLADDLPEYRAYKDKALKSYNSIWQKHEHLRFEGICALRFHAVLADEITLALPLECTGIELAVLVTSGKDHSQYPEETEAKKYIDELGIYADKYDLFAIKFRFELKYTEDKSTRKFIKMLLSKMPESLVNFGYKGCKTKDGGYNDENNAIMNASEACPAMLGSEVYEGYIDSKYDKSLGYAKHTLRLNPVAGKDEK